MNLNGIIECNGLLSATVIKADGSQQDLGVISSRKWNHEVSLATRVRRFINKVFDNFGTPMIVTTAGVNYMASDFASGGATPTISGFKFHASGTGSTAAAVTDTTLGTDSGVARVTGTPTNPSANQYRSVATMAYVSSLAITEWGLFSAVTSGTLWDRRVFSAINVVSGDSIQFTYTLTVNNGGS